MSFWLRGPPGPPGTGTPGTNGRTVLTTSGAPTVGVGADGDFAYDPTAKIMYGPKAAGAWPAGVSLAGSAGAPGATGGSSLLASASACNTAAAWRYMYPGGSNTAVTSNVQDAPFLGSDAHTYSKLEAVQNGAGSTSGAGRHRYALFVNGVITALDGTVTVSTTGLSVLATGKSVTINPGDRWSIQVFADSNGSSISVGATNVYVVAT